LTAKRDLKEKETKPNILPGWQKNFIVGIDDCICVTNRSGRVLTLKEVEDAVEVKGARVWINKQYDAGHHICFLTTRGEKLRVPTADWLQRHGFKYHSLIMIKPKAREYHYIDDRHVQATTFRGKFAPLVREEHKIQVFS
jgi:cation transport regulator ChaC